MFQPMKIKAPPLCGLCDRIFEKNLEDQRV
jgi:hypothetical protein